MSRKVFPIAHAFCHLREKAFAIVVAAHRRPAARRCPYRRHERSDDEAACANAIGETLQRVAVGIDVDVRIEQKQIDAFEADAVDVCGGRQIEHRVQIDRRFRVGAFADEPRPHGVMKSWFGVCSHHVVSLLSSHGAPPVRVPSLTLRILISMTCLVVITSLRLCVFASGTSQPRDCPARSASG